jgi:RimJ/RimL family protein N-acetyltransferase
MLPIRAITPDDTSTFLDLCLTLDAETEFMMYEPGERPTDLEALRDQIRAVVAAPNQTILVVAAGDVLAGYIGLYGGEFRRLSHSAYVVAGVRAAFAGQGLGRRLFEAGEEWARATGLARLELTVMTHNDHALRLYQRVGFEIEGTRRRALRVGNGWVDEFYMGKLLD